jgi:hypothetical protein
VQAGHPEFLASPMIPLKNLGRRTVVVPLISERPIVNNSKNNNKVGKYPIAGFFRLASRWLCCRRLRLSRDGFVVTTEARKSDGERWRGGKGKQLPVALR